MIIAFTGHRPNKLGGYGESFTQSQVRLAIRNLLLEYNPKQVLVGGALGVDTWAAEECLKLGIPYRLVIPFLGLEAKWPKPSQDKFKEIWRKAVGVVVVEKEGYAPWKMQSRNRWMVDKCDLLIAVWDGSTGGTANCYNYAVSKNVKIHRINPTSFEL